MLVVLLDFHPTGKNVRLIIMKSIELYLNFGNPTRSCVVCFCTSSFSFFHFGYNNLTIKMRNHAINYVNITIIDEFLIHVAHT